MLKQMREYELVKDLEKKHLCVGQIDHVNEQESFPLNFNDPSYKTIKNPEEHINIFDNEFQEVVVSTYEFLHQNSPDLNNFKLRITYLPQTYRVMYQKMFTGEVIKDIANADSVSEIFIYFNFHVWNCLEYEVVEHIVFEFGNQDLKDKVQKYIFHRQRFLRSTTLTQFLSVWHYKEDTIPLLRPVTNKHVHLYNPISDPNLQDIETL